MWEWGCFQRRQRAEQELRFGTEMDLDNLNPWFRKSILGSRVSLQRSNYIEPSSCGILPFNQRSQSAFGAMRFHFHEIYPELFLWATKLGLKSNQRTSLNTTFSPSKAQLLRRSSHRIGNGHSLVVGQRATACELKKHASLFELARELCANFEGRSTKEHCLRTILRKASVRTRLAYAKTHGQTLASASLTRTESSMMLLNVNFASAVPYVISSWRFLTLLTQIRSMMDS